MNVLYSNNYQKIFSEECASHNISALTCNIGPYIEGSTNFNHIVKTSDHFQWTLVPLKNRDVKLFVTTQSTHAVCASNQDVITAGDGRFKDGNLYLSNKTGHYKVSFESLKAAEANWESLDIKFDNIVFVDFLQDIKDLREKTIKNHMQSEILRKRYFDERLARKKTEDITSL